MTDRPPTRSPTGDGFDVARARAETPGCTGVLHFNNAGAALMPAPVLAAQVEHLRLEAEAGGYEAAAAAEDKFSNTYDAIARLLGCKPQEVALMENATVAWDMAFHALEFAPGDRILTSEAEYASNYIAYLQVARRTGAVVEPVPSDNTGQLDLTALDSMIDGRVKLISITHVPTNGGLVNPVAEVGRRARANRIPYLLDACQSAGQIALDVDEIGCDMLTATGRKYLRGPRGTGFLYVREDFLERLEPPFLDLRAATWEAPESYVMRADARRFETWEFNQAAIIGLGVAVDYALSWGLEAIEPRVRGAGRETAPAPRRHPRGGAARPGDAALRHRRLHRRGRDPRPGARRPDQTQNERAGEPRRLDAARHDAARPHRSGARQPPLLQHRRRDRALLRSRRRPARLGRRRLGRAPANAHLVGL